MLTYRISDRTVSRTLIALFGMFALSACSTSSDSKVASTPAPNCTGGGVDIARGVDIVEAWRGYKGTDGLSHFERVQIPGTKGAYYGGKVHVTNFDLGDPSGASFVYGEPNMEIPVHPVPYKETFIILSGSSEVNLPDGQVIRLSPGSMVMSEDLGTPGRGGRSGPCGYVALSLAYKAQK